MLRFFIKYRSEDDESAPVDYTFVGSVAEGQRRQQKQPIHQPQAESKPLYDDYRSRTAGDRSAEPRGVAGPLPQTANGPAPAARVAYPRPRDNAFAETPAIPSRGRFRDDQPYDWNVPQAANPAQNAAPTQPQAPIASPIPQGLQNTQPAMRQPVTQTPEGAFAAPAAPEMPEWLRISQQNNLPLYDQRQRRAPRVQAAPRVEPEAPARDLLGRPIRNAPKPEPIHDVPQSASEYAMAGYPPELIEQQMQEEQRLREQGQRMRHGAQYAVNPERVERERRVQRQPVYDPRSYPPPREAFQPRTAAEPEGLDNRRAAYAAQSQPDTAMDDYGYAPRADNPYATPRQEQRWQDEEADATPVEDVPRKPWLGIAVIVAAALCVALWIMQLTFRNETATVLTARAEQQSQIQDKHPYRYRELVEQTATANNLHPAFVAAIILNESSFNPNAESNVGARGLMQMMNDTYEWVHSKIGDGSDASFDQMYDPNVNVKYACYYLSFLCERFRGDPILVAAAFHAGPTTVQNWLNDSRYSADNLSITLENMVDGPTKNYAGRVVNAYAVYKRLYYEDAAQSVVLQ